MSQEEPFLQTFFVGLHTFDYVNPRCPKGLSFKRRHLLFQNTPLLLGVWGQ